jgi:hypothetical protein
MDIEDINKQVEDSPLTKEEAKEQFVEMTEQLGLDHSYNFDEAWEIGQELRRRKDFRNTIVEFEETVREKGGWLSEEDTKKLNPVKHSFADGCYIREIFNPAGELLVTKIHKKEHPFFLMKGKMSILTEEGVKHIEAPHHGITQPGTKRIIYTHEDCVFITVHATDKTDIEEIEKEVIADNFEDPAISLEDINKLKLKL